MHGQSRLIRIRRVQARFVHVRQTSRLCFSGRLDCRLLIKLDRLWRVGPIKWPWECAHDDLVRSYLFISAKRLDAADQTGLACS